jgi:sugar O-acyltransferase (sialic acid O-acetyltransferase NeuD family)
VANETIIIWGASGHAAVVADAVRARGVLLVIGFLDDDPAKTNTPCYGSTILGTRDHLAALKHAGHHRIIFGFGDCHARRTLAAVIAEHGLSPTTVIHPSATISPTAEIAEGAFVNAGAIVNARSRIGAHAIINTAAVVDHDCRIGDFAHIAPGAKLAGGVTIGAEAWIGLGACILENRTIGEAAIIGAGAVVVHDIPARATAYGVPARVHHL